MKETTLIRYIVSAVKSSIEIPVAVKLSPYFSNLSYMANRLQMCGADALVLFNRFYQPDIDIENLEVVPHVLLSTAQDLRLPMRWIALLYGRIHRRCSQNLHIFHLN
jgi:dihydroorotate dehydrogenase (fumarate)